MKIGVFDSGYGGLTILEKIRERLPQYDYIYLGDNARTPYGIASIRVYTMTADDGSCTQRVYARFPWDTTSHCIEGSLSNAMDYVKDAVTNRLKGNK